MIWQIQQPQPWVTLLAWSVWMIHFVDLGHRNSWLRHLDAKRSVKVPDPISSSLSGLSENWKLLKVSYTTANHCTKHPCWGWCWKGLVLMLQNEEWKGSFLHFRSCGAQRALGRMRSPLRIQKPFLFFPQIFNDPGVITRSACRLPMCFSLKGWTRLTAFSMHSSIPKGATSSTMAHGYPLNHRQAKDKTLMGAPLRVDIDEFLSGVVCTSKKEKDQVGPINFSAWLGIVMGKKRQQPDRWENICHCQELRSVVES